tara:strand:+ start:41 stop:361 length:321 start_codon:yes stop_codon:yes gene_type:complete
MKKIKSIFFIILFGSLFYGCKTIKDGFESQRKNSTDEFLVEKKQPLVMPPDFDKLPIPDQNQTKNLQDTSKQIEELIVTNNSNKSLDSNSNSNQNTENFILDKIKN